MLLIKSSTKTDKQAQDESISLNDLKEKYIFLEKRFEILENRLENMEQENHRLRMILHGMSRSISVETMSTNDLIHVWDLEEESRSEEPEETSEDRNFIASTDIFEDFFLSCDGSYDPQQDPTCGTRSTTDSVTSMSIESSQENSNNIESRSSSQTF